MKNNHFSTKSHEKARYSKPIEKEVKDWESKLIYMQDVLEEWLNCQAAWIYLDPIFSSEDIAICFSRTPKMMVKS